MIKVVFVNNAFPVVWCDSCGLQSLSFSLCEAWGYTISPPHISGSISVKSCQSAQWPNTCHQFLTVATPADVCNCNPDHRTHMPHKHTDALCPPHSDSDAYINRACRCSHIKTHAYHTPHPCRCSGVCSASVAPSLHASNPSLGCVCGSEV